MSAILIRNTQYWKWNDSNFATNRPSMNASVIERSWIYIRNGIIENIGREDTQLPSDEIRNLSKEIDVDGMLLLPGLIDSHIHVMMAGEAQYYVDLSSCRSIDDLKILLRNHMKMNLDLPWIIGVAWDQSQLSRYPHRLDLDEVSLEKPIFLWRACFHIGVANTKALELAGVSKDCTSFDVDGGVIDMDESGPTGIFRETAVNIITKAMVQKSNENIMKFIREGLSMCCRYGLTSVQTNDESAIAVYKSLQQSDELPIRVFLTPTYEDMNKSEEEGGLGQSSPLRPCFLNNPITQNIRMDSSESKLVIDRVKIFSDGSLGAETAALRPVTADTVMSGPSVLPGPSADLGPARGVLIHSDASLCAMMSDARRQGYRLEVHAIGDAAAEQVLDAMTACGIAAEAAERAVLTHCQVLAPDLIDRMRSMGVVANVQPAFVPTDMRWASQRLLPTQLDYSYAWKTLLDCGVHVSGGSDAPVEHCSPFLGIHDAIHRRGRGDLADEVFRPEESLSLSDALWIYTVGAAYAAKAEHILGSIQVGYAADFVAVDPKIITQTELMRTYEPEMVIVGGQVVFTKEKYSASQMESPLCNLPTDGDILMVPIRLDGPFIPGKNGNNNQTWKKNVWSCKCCRIGNMNFK